MESFNQETIRRIKENDPTLRVLRISDIATPNPNHGDVGSYVPGDAKEFEQLGVYIGENTYLESLCFDGDQELDVSATRLFCTAVKCNSSICNLSVCRCDLAEGPVRDILEVFGQFNGSLIGISIHRCTYTQHLMEALVNCKDIRFIRLTESRGNLQPIGGLLLNHIFCNSINVLSKAFLGYQKLEELDLGHNDIIGNTGCKALANLLKDPNSNLITLRLENNLIDFVGGVKLAEALKSNKKLKNLYLNGNSVFSNGLEHAFSEALCDTTTINDTYYSNHTLQTFASFRIWTVPSYLELNRSSTDRRTVAIRKIIRHHNHINMEPFFQYELKVLPIAMNWFDRARRTSCSANHGRIIFRGANAKDIGRKELSAIYQFAVAMPMMFVSKSHVEQS